MNGLIPLWARSLWWLAMLFGALASLEALLIVRDLNKQRTLKEAYLGWDFWKMTRLFTEYEQTFPEGKKLLWFKVFFILAGWSLGTWVFLTFWFSH